MLCGIVYDARDNTTSDDLSFIPFLMDRSNWLDTRQMAEKLGIKYRTLHKIKAEKFFTEGHHFAHSTPLPKSKLLWNPETVAAAWTAQRV